MLPESLQTLLTDATIHRVGRNVGGDFARLKRGYNAVCKGAIELGTFCSTRKFTPSCKMSLSDISSMVLGFKIAKDERLSNWDRSLLSQEQIDYAATDAWAGLAIYYSVKDKTAYGVCYKSNSGMPQGTSVAVRLK